MSRSLAQAMTDAGGAVPLLRNSRALPQSVPVVPPEHSNWISEQLAVRDHVGLFDQSHHMVTMTLEGPDLIPFLERIGVNSFKNFPVDRAKQLVACAPDGNLIGQGILFHVAENRMLLVGPHPIMDWVEFTHATTQNRIKLSREGTSLTRQGDPQYFRYQVQGPLALDVMRDCLEAEPPELKFFHMGHVKIAGRDVTLLRHGMAGQPGFEMFGQWADRPFVLEALLRCGEKYDMLQAGGAAYFSIASVNSGYISNIVPPVYTGQYFSDFREWLTDRSWEANAPLGGSFAPENIEDYYLTPFALGYGKIISMDHEFIGREALQAMIDSGESTSRRKVSLVWNTEDIVQAYRSLFTESSHAKFMPLPGSAYASIMFDRVTAEGHLVGISSAPSMSIAHQVMLSPAMVDDAIEDGTEVSVLWGESPNSTKIQVEPHKQVEIRATVAPSPFNPFARTAYRKDT